VDTPQTDLQLYAKRLGHLKVERASWNAHWQEISRFILPRAGRFFIQDRNKGMRRHNEILDSTGTRALRTMAAGMMAGMTSPARPWFRLGTSNKELSKNQNVKLWLSNATSVMLDVFQKSNTYRTLHTMYEELGSFGTAATIVLDDFEDVIRFYPLTCGEYYLGANWSGEIDTLYREFQKTVGEIVEEFGIDAVSASVKSMYDRGELEQWVGIVHVIEPRTARDPTKVDAQNMAWKSCYYELGRTDQKPLRESGHKRFRCLAPRWQVAGGDVYGNSPGMEALGDIKQLQHEQLRKGQGIDYMTNPPLQVPTNLKNKDVERFPGGVTFYDNTGGPQSGIKTMFDVRLDLGHLLADIQDVRSRINATFYADMFLMLSNEGMQGKMTATEVAERHEEKMLMLGPVVERLQNELLKPLIDLTFDRMLETKIIPPPPQELHGIELDVEFVSMLAQAQKAIQVNGIDRFVGSMGAVAQFKPAILDKFDEDAYADIYAEDLSIDPRLIRAEENVLAMRQQRAQQQAAAQKLAAMNSMADTAQKVGVGVQQQPGQSGGNLSEMFSG